MAPVSWRDVFTLLEDHRKESREDHKKLELLIAESSNRIKALEDRELVRQGEQQGEKKILGMARSTFAVAVSLGGLLISFFVPHPK